MLDNLSYCGNADKCCYGICTVVLKGTYFQKCMLKYSWIELQNILIYAFHRPHGGRVESRVEINFSTSWSLSRVNESFMELPSFSLASHSSWDSQTSWPNNTFSFPSEVPCLTCRRPLPWCTVPWPLCAPVPVASAFLADDHLLASSSTVYSFTVSVPRVSLCD